METSIINIILALLEKAIKEEQGTLMISIIISSIWILLVFFISKQYENIIKQAFEIIKEQHHMLKQISKIVTGMTIRNEYEEEIENLLIENKKLQETNGHLNFMIEKKIIQRDN